MTILCHPEHSEGYTKDIMTTDEKINLITRNLEETLTVEELKQLIESGTPLKHYIGFEISGKLHIGHFYQLMKVKDLQKAGAETIIWLADYHSAVNDKLGGDLELIKRIAKDYFIPAMKSLFECINGDPEKLVFKLCSEEYANHPDFWMTFLEMAKATSLSRSKRSITIMGREAAEDSIETAKIMYPIMQAADIFLLQTNIAQAGIDQRKVHVIARDNAMQIKTSPLKDSLGNQIKPIAIHTPILLGLSNPVLNTKEGEGLTFGTGQPITLIKLGQKDEEDNRDIAAMRIKMSKSKADSSISIHDSPEEMRNKINKAYAPEGDSTFNPILNWVEHLVFNSPTTFVVKRDPKWGGNLTYNSYDQLEKDYVEKKLHPMDLKSAVAEWLIEKLAPARKYFEDPQRKAALEEIEKLTIPKS
jgi:tyrosyl-tRNA synthetase